ncbi:hypothetical protein EGY16_35970 [Burkholderia pseudomallei]|uniref:Uncharacterized protein n=1 Tax=Burkholderia pseudomallei TaxID=28450 RepID=A0AAX0U033_BURPE|nr:hypothetical protein EGY16_35970 [Burkholderia pseudomallei]EXJ03045.1 hypothetical protein T210_0105665 [Burkholderia pseudomallei MSHR6137]KAA8768288.1 hypothetical protein F5D26_12280 [Burkholderia pseudomallei]MBM5594055.1 hypothetical protein [Burkholderia pseudomallei]MBM5647293.1 hypothetical protein [Burkholderia pseudomallei]
MRAGASDERARMPAHIRLGSRTMPADVRCDRSSIAATKRVAHHSIENAPSAKPGYRIFLSEPGRRIGNFNSSLKK